MLTKDKIKHLKINKFFTYNRFVIIVLEIEYYKSSGSLHGIYIPRNYTIKILNKLLFILDTDEK